MFWYIKTGLTEKSLNFLVLGKDREKGNLIKCLRYKIPACLLAFMPQADSHCHVCFHACECSYVPVYLPGDLSQNILQICIYQFQNINK